MMPWRLSALLALPYRFAISSVRFGIGWRRGSVLASLDCSCLSPWASSVPPATRSLAQSDFLAASPSYRPLSPITRHGGRGGGSLVSAACLPARSLLPFDFACGRFARVL